MDSVLPEVIINLELPEGITMVNTTLKSSIEAWIDSLGLNSNVKLRESLIRSAGGVTIRIGSKKIWYSNQLLNKVYAYIKGVQINNSDLFCNWFYTLKSIHDTGIYFQEEELYQFYNLLILETLKDGPGEIMSTPILDAYLKNLKTKVELDDAFDKINENEYLVLFSNLLSLGISLKEQDRIARIITDHVLFNNLAIIALKEDLIQNLSSDKIEIIISNEYINEAIFNSDGIDIRQYFHNFHTDFFYKYGCYLPELVISISESVSGRMIFFKFNDKPTIPLIGPIIEYPLDFIKFILFNLEKEIISNTGSIITIKSVEQLLEIYKEFWPKSVEILKKSEIKIEVLSTVCRKLLQEGISLRNFSIIIDAILEFDFIIADDSRFMILGDYLPVKHQLQSENIEFDSIVSFIRIRLSSFISSQHQNYDNQVIAFQLDKEIERVIYHNLLEKNNILANKMEKAIETIYNVISYNKNINAVLLTYSSLRPHLKRILSGKLPELPVLSYDELHSNIDVKFAGKISLTKEDQIL